MAEGDLKALVELPDGRKAWRDGRGRYRDAESGRFIKKDQIKQKGEEKGKEGGARDRARAHLLDAVRGLGLSARDAEDAWGRLVAVQARIALDEGSGARATAAAKLVAQATGLIEEDEGDEAERSLRLEMGEEDARELLRLIREEWARRG